MKRPRLTFPDAVADHVRQAYEKATCILEYGSGGSTVLAAELPGKTVYTIESDPDWMQSLQDYLDQAETVQSMPQLIHADVGKTGKWGRPETDDSWKTYHHYPLAVWHQPEFRHPDLVLIDGRFRPACFYACVLMAEQPMTVLFDDYLERTHYHGVEDLFKPTTFIDRMAVFHTTPLDTVPRGALLEIAAAFNSP